MNEERQQSHAPAGRRIVGQALALAAGLVFLLTLEGLFLWDGESDQDWYSRLHALDFDVAPRLPYFVLFLILPICWRFRGTLMGRANREQPPFVEWMRESPSRSTTAGVCCAWVLAMLVFTVSIGASARIAAHPFQVDDDGTHLAYGDLPPAYHDEFSYLFQAKTFLDGRVSYPSHPTAPRLFDQMHVLNEGKFAGRYFPGTAAWIAPWLALGVPYWGHWVAGGLTAFFVFWSGRELASTGIGLLAGLLTALSPAMGLFSNLLLAHHPGMFALSLFLYCFLRMMRSESRVAALVAGAALTFAMFCRPMTAAGFGLPFGVWFAVRIWRSRRTPGSRWRWALPVCLTVPLVVGFVILFFYNRAITGNGLQTPYQIFTDIHTPRHVYGFNNVVRGEKSLGPRVIAKYDEWAENLTPALAARNVASRLVNSWNWTLGIIPLLMAGVVFVAGLGGLDRRWRLVGAAIVSLHVAHVPYWYDGIMHFHYVFESGPLWCLVFAGATWILLAAWRTDERPLMPVWWCGIMLAALVGVYTPFASDRDESLVSGSIKQPAFSRLRYFGFRTTLERTIPENERALVLVEHDPAHTHIDYVVNEPVLDSRILIGRFRSEQMGLAEIATLFPDRSIYLFAPARNEFRLVRRPNQWSFR